MSETAKSTSERFFYHSFPRRDAANETDLGLQILSSICRNGLLLVGEHMFWPNPKDATCPHQATTIRASFTELAPAEVQQHALQFGQFAIEFTPTNFLRLGGLPVSYIPTYASPHGDSQHTAGSTIISHIFALSKILATCKGAERINGALDPRGPFKTRMLLSDDDLSSLGPLSKKLFEKTGSTLDEIMGSLTAIMSLWHPTEGSTRHLPGDLAYYRQREWRIIPPMWTGTYGNCVGVTKKQYFELLEIDQTFFKEVLPTFGRPRGAACFFFREMAGTHILKFARRVIVPIGSEDNARSILAANALEELPVEALS